jgi:hypothetical protein
LASQPSCRACSHSCSQMASSISMVRAMFSPLKVYPCPAHAGGRQSHQPSAQSGQRLRWLQGL